MEKTKNLAKTMFSIFATSKPNLHVNSAKRIAILTFRSLSSEANKSDNANNNDVTKALITELKKLDTSSLCDADKSMLANNRQNHVGLRLLQPKMRPMNHQSNHKGTTMVGIAYTVQATTRNDFLSVLRGLDEANAGDVLVVNTMESSRAVAGELFTSDAQRKGLAGIIIDGPVRDTIHLNNYPNIRVYATSTTPYSGTTQCAGKTQQIIECGGVEIASGDILVGDSDGIVAGSLESFQNLLPIAGGIHSIEGQLRDRITSGSSLSSMTNLEEHLRRRMDGEESSLQFRL